MAGALPGHAVIHHATTNDTALHTTDDHEMDYVPTNVDQPPPARFGSLRGYGYSRANGRDTEHHYDTAYHGHARGLSRLSEESAEQGSSNRFRTPASYRSRAPTAASSARRVRWNDDDDVRHYTPPEIHDPDSTSSRYSSDDMYVDAPQYRDEEGAVQQRRGNNMAGFVFGFGRREA